MESSGKCQRICVALILCVSVNTYAIDLMGPPTAMLKPPQVSLGLEYSYSEETVMITERGPITSQKLNNLRRNTTSGRLGVGLLDDVELFFRLGAGTLQANEIDFDGNTDPLLGVGAKVKLLSRGKVDLGALFQWSTFDGEETGFIDAVGFHALEEISIDEHRVAAGATVHMDGWRLYGGPFYYVFDGDITITEIPTPSRKIRPDLEEESEYGGYIGVQLDLGTTECLTVEYAHTGEGWGIGISLSQMY